MRCGDVLGGVVAWQEMCMCGVVEEIVVLLCTTLR